jgi:hypothetical protein
MVQRAEMRVRKLDIIYVLFLCCDTSAYVAAQQKSRIVNIQHVFAEFGACQ